MVSLMDMATADAGMLQLISFSPFTDEMQRDLSGVFVVTVVMAPSCWTLVLGTMMRPWIAAGVSWAGVRFWFAKPGMISCWLM